MSLLTQMRDIDKKRTYLDAIVKRSELLLDEIEQLKKQTDEKALEVKQLNDRAFSLLAEIKADTNAIATQTKLEA